jgi:hypothetical protein
VHLHGVKLGNWSSIRFRRKSQPLKAKALQEGDGERHLPFIHPAKQERTNTRLHSPESAINQSEGAPATVGLSRKTREKTLFSSR